MIGQKFYGVNNTGTLSWGQHLEYYEVVEEHPDYVVIDQHLLDFGRDKNIHPQKEIIERIAIRRPKGQPTTHPEYKTFDFQAGYNQLDQKGRGRTEADHFKQYMMSGS